MGTIDFNDPQGTADYLAQVYTQNATKLLAAQLKTINATTGALTTLQSSMQAFEDALNALVSGGNGVVQQSATFSDATFGTATASGSALPGTYQFYVDQLATADQESYGAKGGMPSVDAGSAGTISVKLDDGTSLDVDLSKADQDGDGQVSPAEMARAINQTAGANGEVSASVVTVNGQQQLVLTSAKTGANSAITVDTSKASAQLQAAFGDTQTNVKGQDAIFHMGGANGTTITQASNTFKGIDGVSVTFTRAMKTGDDPVTLTVASDSSATADSLQKFVDAYNALKSTLNTLTFAGDPTNGKAAGPLAADSGMRSLVNQVDSLMRQSVGGTSLLSIGISADKDGNLSLDKDKLQKAINNDPDAVNKLFGDEKTGFVGSMDKYLDTWLNSTSGQIKSRQDTVQAQQKTADKKQTEITNTYKQLYQKYLKEFTNVQAIESQMASTLDILNSLDTSSKK
ncbi:flagellar filament capping protein FliD [Trinickia sp. YCB016]